MFFFCVLPHRKDGLCLTKAIRPFLRMQKKQARHTKPYSQLNI